jgi:hypothetical protein
MRHDVRFFVSLGCGERTVKKKMKNDDEIRQLILIPLFLWNYEKKLF